MSNILEVKNLHKKYPAFELKDVSFFIPQGYIMGFVGPNGAGKTTTIKSILNMIRCDSGTISIFGKDSEQEQASIKERIGIVMDTPFYVEDWTAKDVEAALSPFYGNWNKAKYQAMLKEFDIASDKKVKELSRGMKVKLMLAAAFSHEAQLLILDEPTSGLDPVARDELMDILREFISDESKAVLFSTHITSDLEKIADYITFINNGKIMFTGLKDTLMESYMLVKGGPHDITTEQKKYVIGLREHGTGFEGMISAQDTRKFSKNVMLEPVSLEEIIIHMNKEGKLHD